MPIFLESTATSIPYDPGEIRPDLGPAVDPGEMRAESLELGHHLLVPAVQVIDVVEDGRPFGAEGRHDEGGARTDIGHIDRAAVERARAGDHRAAAFHGDVRAQLAELGHMLKAVFEDGLRDDAVAVRLGHEADPGRLQVRREAWVWPGGHVDGLQPFAAAHPEAVRLLFDLGPRRPQLEDQGPQVSRYNIFENSLTPGRRDGDRVRPGLDIVRDDAMGRAAQLGHALDLQHVGANTLNAGPHLAQKKYQVDDVRLAGGVVDRGEAVGGGGRHHEVLRPRHGRHVEMDGGAGQPVSAGNVLAVFELDARAHQAEADDVLLN